MLGWVLTTPSCHLPSIVRGYGFKSQQFKKWGWGDEEEGRGGGGRVYVGQGTLSEKR